MLTSTTPPQVGGAELGQRPDGRGHPGVVHQAGGRAELAGRVEERHHVVRVGGVDGTAAHRPPAATIRSADVVGGVGVAPIAEHHVVALGGQPDGGGRADAPAAAGDDGDWLHGPSVVPGSLPRRPTRCVLRNRPIVLPAGSVRQASLARQLRDHQPGQAAPGYASPAGRSDHRRGAFRDQASVARPSLGPLADSTVRMSSAQPSEVIEAPLPDHTRWMLRPGCQRRSSRRVVSGDQ